jgi:hypothetical protein
MSGNLNSGRKKKSEDLLLAERLGPLDDLGFEKLKEGIDAGDFKFIRLFFYFRFGSPRQQTEVTVTNTELPLFEINYTTPKN